jgi:hypothetical protein
MSRILNTKALLLHPKSNQIHLESGNLRKEAQTTLQTLTLICRIWNVNPQPRM